MQLALYFIQHTASPPLSSPRFTPGQTFSDRNVFNGRFRLS